MGRSVEDILERRLEGEFEKALFAAARENLVDLKNPLRFNNFAYAMRELIRNVLARLAPDGEVFGCSWFKEETGRPRGISRRQRVYYAVQGGLSDAYLRDELGLEISDIHVKLRDSVDNLSKYTHIEEATFNLDADRISHHVTETFTAVVDLFQTIDECRRVLVEALTEHIDSSVVDAAISETIGSIDELATHHSVEEVSTDDVYVVQIDASFIRFIAEGTVTCVLQWGSNSDVRRGDGATLDEDFPFSCVLTSPVDEPSAVVADEGAFSVDTSSWRDDY